MLENKWATEGVFCGPRVLEPSLDDPPPPWTIGWFGNLRCIRSLEILTELADQLPQDVRIVLRGCTSLLPDGALAQALKNRPNVVYGGDYNAPEDLPALYAAVHFNWCGDFSDGDNSQWLVPNRIYEGGYFGIPAIGIAQHETGQVVLERALGLPLEAPYVDNLKEYLSNLRPDDYHRLRGQIEALPGECFVEINDIADIMSQRISEC